MSTLLDSIEINPNSQATAAVIWLHGLGASAHDFAPIVQVLGLPKNHSIKFIFPHAPKQAVTLNHGFIMPAWYDIYGLTKDTKQDKDGIKATAKLIYQLIEKEIQLGISSERIIIAGFSQGGAMALHCGLNYHSTLGGVIALSTYLPIADDFIHTRHAANQNTPIMLAHGRQDNTVPYNWGEIAGDTLQSLNYQVNWYSYDIAHELCDREIKDIGLWIKKVLVN